MKSLSFFNLVRSLSLHHQWIMREQISVHLLSSKVGWWRRPILCLQLFSHFPLFQEWLQCLIRQRVGSRVISASKVTLKGMRVGQISFSAPFSSASSPFTNPISLVAVWVPGCYAISVVGDLPEDVVETLEDARYVRSSRNFSQRGLMQLKK